MSVSWNVFFFFFLGGGGGGGGGGYVDLLDGLTVRNRFSRDAIEEPVSSPTFNLDVIYEEIMAHPFPIAEDILFQGVSIPFSLFPSFLFYMFNFSFTLTPRL